MDRWELQRVRLRQPCPAYMVSLLKPKCKRLVVGRDIGKKTSRFVEGFVEHGHGEELRPAKGKVKKPTKGCSQLMSAPHPHPTPRSGSTGVSSGLPWVWTPNLCRWSSPMVLKEGPQDRSGKMAQKHVRNTNCLPLSR